MKRNMSKVYALLVFCLICLYMPACTTTKTKPLSSSPSSNVQVQSKEIKKLWPWSWFSKKAATSKVQPQVKASAEKPALTKKASIPAKGVQTATEDTLEISMTNSFARDIRISKAKASQSVKHPDSAKVNETRSYGPPQDQVIAPQLPVEPQTLLAGACELLCIPSTADLDQSNIDESTRSISQPELDSNNHAQNSDISSEPTQSPPVDVADAALQNESDEVSKDGGVTTNVNPLKDNSTQAPSTSLLPPNFVVVPNESKPVVVNSRHWVANFRLIGDGTSVHNKVGELHVRTQGGFSEGLYWRMYPHSQDPKGSPFTKDQVQKVVDHPVVAQMYSDEDVTHYIIDLDQPFFLRDMENMKNTEWVIEIAVEKWTDGLTAYFVPFYRKEEEVIEDMRAEYDNIVARGKKPLSLFSQTMHTIPSALVSERRESMSISEPDIESGPMLVFDAKVPDPSSGTLSKDAPLQPSYVAALPYAHVKGRRFAIIQISLIAVAFIMIPIGGIVLILKNEQIQRREERRRNLTPAVPAIPLSNIRLHSISKIKSLPIRKAPTPTLDCSLNTTDTT